MHAAASGDLKGLGEVAHRARARRARMAGATAVARARDHKAAPDQGLEIIKRMHRDAPTYVKKDYGMEFRDGDCFMTWRFAVVCGVKHN
jgi:hypothetical protein